MANKLPTIAALKAASALARVHPDQECIRYDWMTTFTGDQFRAWFRARLNEKINRAQPKRGRKDCSDWYMEMCRAARMLNEPRLCIHWLPADLLPRFSARLAENERNVE